ncbi:1-aminocyclopropane-1-carboxylate oxidase homolog 4-like [Punica granatum]|uniref:1-aminocyclopropane-1-carboxylate oxidase homolog 4-like n=1 Tax=Punica granatum TaxID=22663 RepID=A0A6P8DNV6_PUNGR|nr:1-aminocyclopropane-1-carboxylate oxidase homolog 4-like [Punica granatum]
MAATDAAPSTYDRTKAIKEFDESKMGVKGLSESGITSIPEFFIHPPQTLSDLRSSSRSSPGAVPVIDISGINSIADRPNIVRQVRDAAKSWGFFQVVNHGVPAPVLDDTINAIRGFHEQPHENKAKYYKRQEGQGVMFASNNDLYRTEAASWHDSLQVWMGPQPPVSEEIPEVCRREVIAWDGHAKDVADKVMELLSEGLGLEPGMFRELTFSDARTLVGHCYPHCPQPDLTLGITSHTDPGIITVLLTNRVPGLQVKHEDDWTDVDPVPGGLIINIGDFLQIVSNGEYKSVQHRVLANGMKEPRISIVEFFNLTKWKDSDQYGPLPELVFPDRPAIYRDFTKQEFLDNFYSKGLDNKSLIDRIKV